MVCNECVIAFFYNPFKLGVVITSFLLALLSFIFIRRKGIELKKKIFLIYAHIFFLVFPFIFYLFFRGCQVYFYSCGMIKPTMIMLILTFFSAGIIGLIAAPFIFLRKYSRGSLKIKDSFVTKFINKYSKKLNISCPEIYVMDIAKPIAFSFSFIKKRIFVSIGMFDILSKKELNAVLLHELAHIKNRSSLFKFSTFFMKLSPLAMFNSFNKELDEEEVKADNVVFRFQRTNKYLVSAKEKICLFDKGMG